MSGSLKYAWLALVVVVAVVVAVRLQDRMVLLRHLIALPRHSDRAGSFPEILHWFPVMERGRQQEFTDAKVHLGPPEVKASLEQILPLAAVVVAEHLVAAALQAGREMHQRLRQTLALAVVVVMLALLRLLVVSAVRLVSMSNLL